MDSRGKILVVDDDESTRELVTLVLGHYEFDVVVVESAEKALTVIKQQDFDLVITDIQMEGMTGIALLEKLKEMNPDLQVVIMTSHASFESSIKALRLGAYDYLVKPFEDVELILVVASRAIEKAHLRKENERLINELESKNTMLEMANYRLRELALKDGLTNLYNHRFFQEAINKELENSKRYNHEFSLLFMDVDYFKVYNDKNGHLYGDTLLQTLGGILSTRSRESDIVARYGGEEFVVLLSHTSKENACVLAEDLRKQIEEHEFPGEENQPDGVLTVSMGVSTFPEDGEDAHTLIDVADSLLYKAKDGGRNQVQCCPKNLKKQA